VQDDRSGLAVERRSEEASDSASMVLSLIERGDWLEWPVPNRAKGTDRV